jgi:hypothetical protein
MDEPCARRTLFAASRAAVVDLWGDDGLAQLGSLLPDDARRDTLEPVVVSSDWFPERYMLAWYEAVWDGPAKRQPAQLRLFIDQRMNHGFGRVRRFLLRAATPAQLVAKAPQLWRHDHTTGTMSGALADHVATLRLHDHPYTTVPLARLATAEVYRYAASLLRGPRNVVESHGVEADGALVVRVTWE